MSTPDHVQVSDNGLQYRVLVRGQNQMPHRSLTRDAGGLMVCATSRDPRHSCRANPECCEPVEPGDLSPAEAKAWAGRAATAATPGTDVVVADTPVVAPGESGALTTARGSAEGVLRQALTTLDALVDAYAADLEGQARVYVLLNRLTADIKALNDRVVANLVEHMPDKRVVVDGVGMFERRYAVSNSAWAHDDLWAHIARTVTGRYRLIDPETGEDATGELVGAVIAEARAMQTPGSWRKTALRDRGIDPDEVSTVNWGRRTVQYTAASGASR